MQATDYLRERGESENAFAKRAGLHQRTLNRALRGNCSLRIARIIVRTSQEEPTPSGGVISYDDLAEVRVLDVGRKRRPRAVAVHKSTPVSRNLTKLRGDTVEWQG